MIETPNFTLLGETTHFPDVVHCETFLARAPTHKWLIPTHRHAQMAQLFEITSGTVLAKIDDATINLSDGDFLYVPAQCVHGFDVAPHTDGRIMSFPQPILASIGPTSNTLPSALDRFFSGKVMPQLASLTNTLSETLNTSKMFRQQIAVGLAHAVLGTIASLAPSTQFMPSDPRLADFDALILQHQKLGLSAADYAALLGVSTGHLSRLCRKATGRGAGAYIERSTMNEACRLLAFTRMPVAEIGYQFGYSDPSYFSKRFRAARGQTPTQYRAAFAS